MNLSPTQSKWVEYVRKNVAPRIGARAAALVTWWALKEGILNLENPWRHNLCNRPGGDVKVGDLDTCGSSVWQIGMSGIQGSAVTEATVEATAIRLYPGASIEGILARIADDAGVDSATRQAVASSTGLLRKAWLLRDPAISFYLQAPFVEKGCVTGNYSWCYGSWDTARAFAADKNTALATIAELESMFASSGSLPGLPSATKVLPFVVVGIFLASYAAMAFGVIDARKIVRALP
jgi:hypothetical protein